jgi:hypothetical protein
MGIEMIICPNCHHQEYAGALFCSECATQLVVTGQSYVVGATDIIEKGQAEMPSARKRHEDLGNLPGDEIFLKLLPEGAVIELAGHREFTIGRGVKGQLILPDIDLDALNAHAMGVSRLHAVMKVTETQVILMDLGSSNGTWINGRRIKDHVESVVKHGDVVALGKLQFEVLFNL